MATRRSPARAGVVRRTGGRLPVALVVRNRCGSRVRPRPDLSRAAPWRDTTRPTLDEMCYDAMKRDQPATRLQRELGLDLIGLSAPMRIVTNAYKT